MPLTSSSKQHDAADFIIEVIRTLRHTKNDNTEKLFELLSVPDFPVDKCRLLEDLIQQAYHYNKDIVAKQLAKYRSEILQGVSTANNEMKE
ncbi:hypothetical protein KP509_03G096300 [Ceratopteris richardii]|nr:hypothetical protein KP509_03G096300 [Ceratopteris richardii]